MTRVKLASARTFPNVAPNKPQALKVLEEASETVEAFKKWFLANGFQKCNAEKVPADFADAEFADLMDPCDYEELHARLADLIEPTVETCEADLTDVIEARVAVREHECSKCGMSWETVWAYDFSYCPYCGRMIENADE